MERMIESLLKLRPQTLKSQSFLNMHVRVSVVDVTKVCILGFLKLYLKTFKSL